MENTDNKSETEQPEEVKTLEKSSDTPESEKVEKEEESIKPDATEASANNPTHNGELRTETQDKTEENDNTAKLEESDNTAKLEESDNTAKLEENDITEKLEENDNTAKLEEDDNTTKLMEDDSTAKKSEEHDNIVKSEEDYNNAKSEEDHNSAKSEDSNTAELEGSDDRGTEENENTTKPEEKDVISKPEDDNTTETDIKPIMENNIEPCEKPAKANRGTKRKASEVDKNDNSSGNQESKTTEQKENVDSKNDENVQKDSQLKEDASLKSLPESDVMGKGKRARIPNKRYSDIMLSPNRRISSHPKPPDVSSDIDEITIKEEPLDSTILSVSSPSLPKKQRTAPKENLQDPKFLKPFKYGWKRELVWRSTSTSTKPIGDIYYYTPTGKKARSFRDVSDYLTGKSLSLDNFSFTKEPLGLNDPEKEIIRDAKIKSSDSFSESPALKKLEIRKPKKVLNPEPPKAEVIPVKRKADPPVPKEPPTTNSNSSKKVAKMPPKKSKTPVAKKPKLSPKVENSPRKVETPPPPPPTLTRTSPAKTRAQNSAPKIKKRNLKLKSITNTNSTTTEEKSEAKFMENYLQNLSFGYNTLLYVFQYLKVQDLLRAGCVCTMWRDIASHPILWRTVRMKNSQVHSFEGLANTLKKHGTVHLDLRKMLLPSNGDEIWPEFSEAIAKVDTLKKIELCRCPATVVEQLATSNPTLEIINAVTIKCESMNLDPLKSLTNIRELRLKSTSGLNINSIDSLKELKTLKVLSLTSVNELHKLDLTVIAELTCLESLDLGECTDFPVNFGPDILCKLENLEKLRLEKGQGSCHTLELLDAVKNIKKLEQLELVNFDVKNGFDKALGACTNIKKLMIIPTYISQSATTNNMVLAGVLRLQGSLTHFVWGVTLELLRVTELFVDQCEDSNKKDKKPTGNGDSIPVLKPVPDLTNGGDIQAASNPPQVEILPLPNLQKLLLNSLPTTRVKILKIPFHATWRQTLTDSV